MEDFGSGRPPPLFGAFDEFGENKGDSDGDDDDVCLDSLPLQSIQPLVVPFDNPSSASGYEYHQRQTVGQSWREESGGSSSSPASSSSSAQSPPTPLPHTPLFSPPYHFPAVAASSSDAHANASEWSEELPTALVESGWRRCWSSREKRHYFFNKLTQQSSWEVPALPSSSSCSSRKRASSSDSAEQPAKRFVPSSDWDLSVGTSIRIRERLPLTIYPPHPDMEAKRQAALLKLHQYLIDLCKSKEGIEEPTGDVLVRWLIERKACGADTARDPLFPAATDIDANLGLIEELSRHVPVRWPSVPTVQAPTETDGQQQQSAVAEARRALGRYAEAARRLADASRLVSPADRKRIKWQSEEMFTWLRQSPRATPVAECQSRLRFLRAQCQTVLDAAGKPMVEQVCLKLSEMAKDLGDRLQQEHAHLLTAAGVDISEPPLPAPREDKVVGCYAAQLRFGSGRLPSVSMEQSPDGRLVRLRYRQECLKLNAQHFFKLEQLYRYNCFDDRRFDLFLPRVWSLLKRYQSLFGAAGDELSARTERSLPVAVLRCVARQAGVALECFANPFSCFFRQFCSPFADTDGFFGSRGPFARLRPRNGAAVALLPLRLPRLAQGFCDAALRALAEADGPLSLVVVAPLDAADDETLAELRASAFNGRRLWPPTVLRPLDHWFRHGAQQWLLEPEALYERSTSATEVIILQNELGAKKWPMSDAHVEELVDAFRFPLPTLPPPTLD